MRKETGTTKKIAKLGIEIFPKGTRGSETKIARITITGNVGEEGRNLLDELKMDCVSDVANCREYWSNDNNALMALRKSLIDGLQKLNIELTK